VDALGRSAQPLRLARDRRLPDLGLPGALPAPGARRDAARGRALRARLSNLFLVLHVGLLLAAFAGFTLAAALAALYLFQERRLKRREASILRLPAPSLAALDVFTARTIAVSLPALTLGIAVGLARLAGSGGAFDAVVAATLATWIAYAGFIVLRHGFGWRGRRAAYLAVAGFALVLVVLPIGHFS